MSETTIPRNKPCPCGSGKKWKRCCGSATKLTSTAAPEAKLPVAGLAGERFFLMVKPKFIGSDPRNDMPVAGSLGEYIVTFKFCRQGARSLAEAKFKESSLWAGDSHIAIAGGATVGARAGRFSWTFDLKANSGGFMEQVVTRCRAGSHSDAHRQAYGALAPLLSIISARSDVPLQLAQVDTRECESQTLRMELIIPPAPSTLPDGSYEMEPEFRYYAGIYREALNASSPAYRYLCFYKVVEAIFVRRAGSGGGAKQFERFPSESDGDKGWLRSLYGDRVMQWGAEAIDPIIPDEARGKKFGWVREKYLNPLRTKIAHALLDDGALGATADDLTQADQIWYWLPAVRVMARRMMKNDFAGFLPSLPEPEANHVL